MKAKNLETSITIKDATGNKMKVTTEVTISEVESIDDLKTLCNSDPRRMASVINTGLQNEYRNKVRALLVKNVDDPDCDGIIQREIDNHVAGQVVVSATERRVAKLMAGLTPEEQEQVKAAVKQIVIN